VRQGGLVTFGRGGDRHSIFGVLRPGRGQTVSRAVVTTYSLDLIAMLGLVLSLGGDSEAEYESSPLGLVKAFEAMRGRLIVLHQLGRVLASGKHRSVLPLLDTMVHAVRSNERAESWHPKIALVRYEADREAEWRFWIGSRNLTGSTDRDAGLLLVTSRERGARRIPEIGALAADLLAEAKLTPAELAELGAARWKAPPGVGVRTILWRRNGALRPFVSAPLLARADRGCAVSPFIDRTGLGEVLKAGAKSVSLLTTEMAGAGCAPFAGVKFHVDTAPEPEAAVAVEQQQEEAAGDFSEPPSTGVHAKLLAVSRGERTALMLGSANLTKRGLIGPNAEAVAILDISDGAVAQSLYGFVESGLDLHVCEADRTEELETERAKRALDGLISQFLQNEFALAYRDDGLHVSATGDALEVLALARFHVSPFLDAEAWVPIPYGTRSLRLLANPPPASEHSTLINFRACSLDDPEVCRTWVQALEVEGIDAEKRDRALLARYVGANRFRDWLRSLLDGVDGTGGQRWSDPAGPGGLQDPSGALAQIFTLETMLAAWARDPRAFESRVGGMMVMLESFEEVFATIADEEDRLAALKDLEEVRPFLQAVHQAIGAAA
jgi:hypothetical protein